MNKWLAVALGAVCLAGVAYGAGSDPWRGMGDRKFDSMVQSMNREAMADPDGFIRQLSARHGIPESDLRQARETHGLDPGDLYMASSLAWITHRPILVVAEDYKKNPGRGWGEMAKEMGIKPGSREFHDMKADARGSLADMKSMAKARQKHERQMMKEQKKRMKQESKGRGQGAY